TAVFSQKVRPPPPGLNPARQGLPEGRSPPRDERPPPPDGIPPGRRSANQPPGPNGQTGPEPEFLIEPEDPNAWQLIVKYKSGSLEQTVNQTRWRNLISSFGTLLILSGSIALLAMAAFRARKLATQQMEFVAGVSHELRTPLAIIQSTSYNLAKGMISDGRRVQQYGEVIQNESRRLINQVEQMLSFAGIQSGRQHYDLRPERVEQIIERALAEYAAAFAASGWLVEQRIAADLPMVLADNQSLESAIKNLLQNALKYAAGAKHLTITAEVAKNGVKKEVLITVADRGPGVDAADLPHIFKPFYRGKKVWDSPVTGTGLGLSLVERHLRAHGGRVTVNTSPEEGTAFTLHLPALEKPETDSTL
ncbi:MAG: HAMP domain-containing sensor histidine kinase, partial [Acidobacteriota bacterium]